MSQNLKNLFTYKSRISRSGFLLILIAIFLTIISFIKGIQILIFIPSFIVAIFLYSLVELIILNKHLTIWKYSDNNWNYLKIYVHEKYNSNFIIWNKKNNWEIEFLEIQRWNYYQLDKNLEYDLIVFVFWSFDIFRKKINIWKLFLDWNKYKINNYVISEKYNVDKEISKIDSLKTSLSEVPYIKELNSVNIDKIDSSRLNIISNIKLNPTEHKNILKLHFILILLWLIWLFIEWNNIVLNSIIILNILLVFLLRKNRWKIKNIYKNVILISTFALMIFLTYIQRDMSWPWSMFLLQILINIYLFPKDFRNSFLYIFLLLFVFVAISLFSNQIRFIILFLLYIYVSIYLLFFISGSEDLDENNYKFWKNITFIKKIKIIFILIILMFWFFFILPHWNKIESKTDIFFNNNEWNISGFNEDITLDNLWDIAQDNTKVIVVEWVNESDIEKLWLDYFRWKRFDYFNWKKWLWTFDKNYTVFNNSINQNNDNLVIESLKIQFELNGWKNIFLPAYPYKINSTTQRIISRDWDETTLELTRGINESFWLEVDFLTSNGWEIIDSWRSSLDISNDIYPDIDSLFEEYFAKIPDEYKDSPEKLTEYVKNESWFKYSVTDISSNFEDFLYGSKMWHCEYFASTLMIVLQKYWYSPTLVSGFLQWEYNSLANSYIVRWKNAHSWVELYDQETNQWIIYDATPEIDFSLKTTIWMITNKIIDIYDFIDIKWYTYIANYTWDEQIKIYKKILNNKYNILKYVIILSLIYFLLKYIIKSKNIILLSKKEKILFILSKYYKKDNNVISKMYQTDKQFAKKIEKYVYWNKWNISYLELLKKILFKK